MRQAYNPNLNAFGRRGWCLEYVDNAGGVAVKAPPRLPSAQAALNAERKAKRLRTTALPLNVWVPIFFEFRRGPFTHLGHVALARRKSNGSVEIRDTETRSGARAVYQSIQQLINWFGAYSPSYAGWSTHCSGRKYAEPKPKAPKRISRYGTARVVVDALNVRDNSSTSSKVVAQYKKGQTFNYDSYIKANGYTWLSYISWSGKRRYVAQAEGKTKYVTGGV